MTNFELDKKRREDPYWDFFHTRNRWEEDNYAEFGFFGFNDSG